MPEWWVVVLAIGAVARITRFVHRDTIAAPVRNAYLKRVGDHSLAGELVRCDWCLAIWVAIPVTIAAALIGETAWFWGPALALTVAWVAAVVSIWADA